MVWQAGAASFPSIWCILLICLSMFASCCHLVASGQHRDDSFHTHVKDNCWKSQSTWIRVLRTTSGRVQVSKVSYSRLQTGTKVWIQLTRSMVVVSNSKLASWYRLGRGSGMFQRTSSTEVTEKQLNDSDARWYSLIAKYSSWQGKKRPADISSKDINIPSTLYQYSSFNIYLWKLVKSASADGKIGDGSHNRLHSDIHHFHHLEARPPPILRWA